MTFTQWWAQNGAVYEKAGVTEPIAKAIWVQLVIISRQLL